MKLTAGLILLCTAFSAASRAAEGVRILPDSAEGVGLLGARFALSDDPSSVRSNPARLTLFDGAAFQLNSQVWYGETDFTRFDGARDSKVDPWVVLAGLNIVYPINDTITAGLGVSAPYGVGINWRRDGLFRYIAASEALLETFAINPAIGIQLTDKLSAGVGADIFYSHLKLEQAFPWALVSGRSSRDGHMIFEGDGWGLGAYVGLDYEINENHRIAIAGHLPVTVEYQGDFDINNIPDSLKSTYSSHTGFESEIEFPASVGIGYGWNVTDRLSLGADFEWIQNSSHDDLPLAIGRNQSLLGVDALELGWKDSFSTGVGFEYAVSDTFRLRGGYLYSESPLEDAGYTPSIPVNDRHMLSLGCGYDWGPNTIDLTYASMIFEDREVRGAAQRGYDGTYENFWHILAISYTRHF